MFYTLIKHRFDQSEHAFAFSAVSPRFLGSYYKLRILVFSPSIYGPRASHLGHKSKGKKLGP